ncbi:MAG: hypothetical protein COV01_03835 [Candidatus Taylorbacteria bacterium CG10_big_fil_rev_8_21_14_0_10_41_48]|uniref:Cytochrome C biogenesis protein transmembrane domain-containing protein n=1 Tax=Candidatus Taylorbacteria bacterium CG10_big_fil_rev_8_21_14_0_10_41_48 TaxID=1975024 RepID=A0A2M8LBD4_9BACT|nr:MAG: hypothetical protein COV01_03835 [Candidatus Taylorbacteria bacterium CG10_big_fil_rev_8_21_14_0_10_41_48]
MSKKISISLVALAVLTGIIIFFKFGGVGSTALWNVSGGGTWLLPLISVAALLDSINPCAFSVLFLTIAFLMSMGAMRSSVLRIGGAYIFGIFIVYLGIGLGILQALSFFGVPHFMSKVGAWLIIALGVWSLMGNVFPRVKTHLGIPQVAHRRIALLMEKASVPTALILGGFVGLCEFPCTGGPYLMVLGLLHDSGTYYQGLGYLIWYNLIFVLPLIVILFVASDEVVLAKIRAWRTAENSVIKIVGSVALLLLGVAILLI